MNKNDVISRYTITENGKVYDKVNKIFLYPFRKPDGFLYIVLLIEAKTKNRFGWLPKSYPLADLVLKTYAGEPKSEQVACYLDGNTDNCRLNNLIWDTKSQRAKLRTLYLEANPEAIPSDSNLGRGKGKANTKLTEEDVLQIRQLVSTKQYRQTEVAKIYGVTTSVVSNIITEKTRKGIV